MTDASIGRDEIDARSGDDQLSHVERASQVRVVSHSPSVRLAGFLQVIALWIGVRMKRRHEVELANPAIGVRWHLNAVP